jgi:predicted RNA binding protein YcfA (HicA-like mRNA interferase family)
MTKKEKLLLKSIKNPISLNFEDFRTLLKQSKWTFDHQTGSHQIWYSPKGNRISIQNNKGKAKSYQVKQFLQQKEKETKNEK